MKNRRARTIAPRLANGERRQPYGGRLPEPIKDGLRLVAVQANESMSWVLEKVIIKALHLPRPEYFHRPTAVSAPHGLRKAS